MKKIYLYAILATFASMSMLTSCDADAEFETCLLYTSDAADE